MLNGDGEIVWGRESLYCHSPAVWRPPLPPPFPLGAFSHTDPSLCSGSPSDESGPRSGPRRASNVEGGDGIRRTAPGQALLQPDDASHTNVPNHFRRRARLCGAPSPRLGGELPLSRAKELSARSLLSKRGIEVYFMFTTDHLWVFLLSPGRTVESSTGCIRATSDGV